MCYCSRASCSSQLTTVLHGLRKRKSKLSRSPLAHRVWVWSVVVIIVHITYPLGSGLGWGGRSDYAGFCRRG
jgi:hypothetical protein